MLPLKNASFLQAGIGLTANTFLLLSRILTLFLGHRPKPHDLLTGNLALVHILMLLTMLFLSPGPFESLRLQNDVKCKALFYLSRVMRGLSICTTCLLSMLQAVTISPSSSWLGQFKQKSRGYTIHSLLFLWILCLSFSSNLLLFTVAASNVTQTQELSFGKYCSLSSARYLRWSLFFRLIQVRDVSFVGGMLFSSVYMVTLLFRHQRRSQHLHNMSLSPSISPEKRATQIILLLVSFFVVMYWVDLVISSISIMLVAYGPVILGVQTLVLHAYATVSPLVIIIFDKRIISTLQNMQQKAHRFLSK
ncbi:vomeronasal type-1 receptor 51 isoform X1 [Microcebus murinus]|uniref:vomeronasal type-1 receptor 51-like isoform X1 n=1 Tax=Microcebus murinus TaxID=30608 RepID=UPI003F6CF1C8